MRGESFTQADIAEISALMARVPRNDSPAEERRAIAYAIAWMERRVAPTVGTASDRASMDFGGSGDSTQQDCVDEATNTTSYLLVLKANGLITHHTVEGTMSKENLAKGLVKLNPVAYWPHWSAILKENKSGQKYAVDRWPFDQGENPASDAVVNVSGLPTPMPAFFSTRSRIAAACASGSIRAAS